MKFIEDTNRCGDAGRGPGRGWFFLAALMAGLTWAGSVQALERQPGGTTVAAPAPGAAVDSRAAVRFSSGVDGVVKMVDAGVDRGVIETFINYAPIAYNPSADEIIALHRRNVPSGIIAAMIRRGGALRAQAALVQPASPAAPQAASYPTVAAPSRPVPRVVTYAYPAQSVYPDYSYLDAYPDYAYAYYPGYCYTSLGGCWGWPYYGYRCGWPWYGCRNYGWWGGYGRCGSSYCYPRSSFRGFGGGVGFNSGHFSGSFHSTGHAGGSVHRGR